MNRSKDLEKLGKASTRVIYNNYFSFSKAYHCFVCQILSYYYNNLEVNKVTQAKSLRNLL